MLPPDPTSLDPRGLGQLLFLLRRFQRLSRQDQYNQIQLMTMSAVDFLDQWFETDVLKATMSASGIIGTFLGVRSPGTAYVLLHHYMGEIDGAFRSWGFARGGTGAISLAIAGAARQAGVEIRAETEVAKILVRDGRAAGVVLKNGDEITANLVVSSLDPRLTFRRLLEADQLPGDFLEDVDRYKFRGSSAKVNLALDALPDFTALPGTGPHLRGAISNLAERGLHGARVRRSEVRPLLTPSLYGHRHPIAHRSERGTARSACDVVLRPIRSVSSGRRHVGRSARRRSVTPSWTRSPSTRPTSATSFAIARWSRRSISNVSGACRRATSFRAS
jgi:hypothetical protein